MKSQCLYCFALTGQEINGHPISTNILPLQGISNPHFQFANPKSQSPKFQNFEILNPNSQIIISLTLFKGFLCIH